MSVVCIPQNAKSKRGMLKNESAPNPPKSTNNTLSIRDYPLGQAAQDRKNERQEWKRLTKR